MHLTLFPVNTLLRDIDCNKLEINFLNTTGKDTLPFCEFNTVNPFSHKVDRKKFQDNLHTLQDKIIEGFKKQTPKDLDEYTVLQDVYKNNNELFFKLTIKNTSIKDSNDETLKAFLTVFAVDKYVILISLTIKYCNV